MLEILILLTVTALAGSMYLAFRWRKFLSTQQQLIANLNMKVQELSQANDSLRRECSNEKFARLRSEVYGKQLASVGKSLLEIKRLVRNSAQIEASRVQKENTLGALSAIKHSSDKGANLVPVVNVAEPQTLQQGLKDFYAAEYKSAFKLLLPHAEKGDIPAQRIIAKLYYEGNGVEQDKGKYVYWLEQSANLGDKTAKAKLKRLKKKA
jgi:TPR repeat protein